MYQRHYSEENEIERMNKRNGRVERSWLSRFLSRLHGFSIVFFFTTMILSFLTMFITSVCVVFNIVINPCIFDLSILSFFASIFFFVLLVRMAD